MDITSGLIVIVSILFGVILGYLLGALFTKEIPKDDILDEVAIMIDRKLRDNANG